MPVHEGLNTELLLKVKAHILEEPKRLLMNYFFVNKKSLNGTYKNGKFTFDSTGWGEPKTVQMPKCNTIGCIAGWTVLVNNPDFKFETGFSFEQSAKDLLNIQTRDLFFISRWPNHLSKAYIKAKTRKQRAILVGKAIDAFINGEF